jgi:SPP1 family predicted phage head-tail adaptor
MSARASINELRARVALEAPVDAPDGAGGSTRRYEPVTRLWAAITPLAGAPHFIAQRQEQSITHRARLRWRSDLRIDMRLVLGARRLLIRAVYDEDERRRFLVCHCEEIDT